MSSLQPTAKDDFEYDRRLTRRALSGERAAIDELLERLGCVRRILSSKNARTGGRFDASELEDLVQETLFEIWRRLGDYEGRGPLEAWAHRFCALILMARRRKAARAADLLQDIALRPEPPSDPEAPVDPELIERIYSALDIIGSPDAEIIRMKHFEDLTFDQIAATTKTPVNTVKSRYYRGLQKARAILGAGVQNGVGVENREVAG